MLLLADEWISSTEETINANGSSEVLDQRIVEMQTVYNELVNIVPNTPDLTDYIEGVVDVGTGAVIKLSTMKSMKNEILELENQFNNLKPKAQEYSMPLFSEEGSVIFMSMKSIHDSINNENWGNNTKLERDVDIAQNKFYHHSIASILEAFENIY